MKHPRLILFSCLGILFAACLFLQAANTPVLQEPHKMKLTINQHAFSVTLANNQTAEAFRRMLPLQFTMNDLNHNEKYYYLSQPLPSRPQPIKHIQAGDIMLFGEDCLVVFYKSFTTSYSYTPIGRVDNAEHLAKIAGPTKAEVSFQ